VNKYIAQIAVLAGAMQLAGQVDAQSMASAWGLYVFPSAGQSPEKQRDDELQCKDWSTQMTGVDPSNPAGSGEAKSAAQPSQEQSGEGLAAAQGAVRGAAGAALIGNLAGGHASTWGWAGAVAGSVRGASRREQQNQEAQAQAQQQAQAQAEQRMGTFKKAFTACMQGKKYTVN
jgi:hypothetical protein